VERVESRLALGRRALTSIGGAVLLSGLGTFGNWGTAHAAPNLIQISSDPYTNSGSQHATENEPSDFAWGSTIVASTQVGRDAGGGSANIGWATSTDGGATWTHGFFNGITPQQGGGPNSAASDTVVAYDAAHGRWLDSILGVSGPQGNPVYTVTSTDGLNWDAHPHTVATGALDKNWLVCDNTSTSPFYGHCYTEWDDTSSGNLEMSTSTDGGQTWSPAAETADHASGSGGVPQVLPSGTVVVPYDGVRVFTSTNGGASWGATRSVASQPSHGVHGMRADSLISSSIDGDGRVYVAWEDCRFRSGCSSNDIVYTSSTDGATWSAVTRVPIDPVTSTVEHFTPGFGADPHSHVPNVHLGVSYDFMPNAACAASACQISMGFISSVDGGSSWGTPMTLNPTPMMESWMPVSTGRGAFLGDYQTTTFTGDGVAHPSFEVASAPSGGLLHQALNTMSIPVGGAPPPTVSGSPTGVTASSGSPGTLAVTWSPPANNGGSPIVEYAIWTYSAASGTGTMSVSTTPSLSESGLTSNTYYIVTVTAYNSVGWSAWSNYSSWTLAQ